MAIDAGQVLRDAATDLASARGAVIYVLFAAFAVASLPVNQTLTRETTAWFVDVAEIPPEQAVFPTTPLALDVGLPGLVAGLVAMFVVAELLHLLAIRAFASDAAAAVPLDEVTEGGLRTVVVLFAASLVVQVLVYGGLVAFIIPGLIAAVLTLFVRQAVVLDGDGVIDAVRSSISIAVDETIPVVLLALVLIAASFVLGVPAVVLDPASPITPITGAVLGAVTTVYGIAVFTRAFQVAGAEPNVDEPLGPEDLADENLDDGR